MKLYVLAEDHAFRHFWAQHGISFMVEYDGHRFLFDTGTDYEPVKHNADLLNLEVSPDFVVISHPHYDHAGGLLGLLNSRRDKLKVYATPDILKDCYQGGRDIGPPKYLRWHEKARWILKREPVEIEHGIRTTGEVPATGQCFSGEVGLVIEDVQTLLVGCSHPGILSMVKRANEVSGKEVKRVIGGFHMLGYSQDEIDAVVKEMQDLGIEEVYTGHCTGLAAECAFRNAYGDNFHLLHAGMTIELSER